MRYLIIILLILFICGCTTAQVSNEKLLGLEDNAYVRSGYVEAALFQQSYVQLIAPDVQMQLQHLADEIAVANGVDMKFRVHITNDNYLGTMSTGSGDIFIPMIYLNMVSNRDEIVFGLAREIALQHRRIPLHDMEKIYQENQRNQMISQFSSLVLTSVIHSTFNYYVTSPLRNKIIDSLVDDPKVSPYLSAELQQYVGWEHMMWRNKMSEAVSPLLNMVLGPVPSFVTNQSLKLVAHMITISAEESDDKRRNLKNELGLIYLGVAGYNPESGKAVIEKIEKEWALMDKAENAEPE